MIETAWSLAVGVSYLLKAGAVLATAADIHKTYHDGELTTEEKAHRIGTNVLFMGFQTVDVGASLSSLSTTTRMIAHVGAGAASVAKEISKKAIQDDQDLTDVIDICGVAALRTGDVTELACELFPQSEHIEALKELTEGALSSGSLLTGRMGIKQTLFQTIDAFYPKESTLSNLEKSLQELDEVRSANTIEDFTSIPAYFLREKDPLLHNYICPITEKPIRSVVCVQSTRNTQNQVFYEKKAIEQFILKKTRQYPPKWPDKVSVRLRKLTEAPLIQEKINNRLSLLLNETKAFIRSGQFDRLYQDTLERFLQRLDEVRLATTIEDFSSIPKLFLEKQDSLLRKYICPLTKKPIRHIVVVRSTRNTPNPLYYEKTAIEQFISRHPNELPNGWPITTPVQLNQIVRHVSKQAEIDSRLTTLFNQTKTIIESGRFASLYQKRK